MEKLESDLENFVRLCHLHEKAHNLEQALAEKDRELAQRDQYWKTRVGLDCGDHSCLFAVEHKGMRTNGGCRCNPKRLKEDYELLCTRYRTLMAQAVWFARQLGVERVSGGLSYIEYPEKAQDFLASPEVQAWKEQS